jgi:acetyl-CoA carboxylase carboxyltransferase component
MSKEPKSGAEETDQDSTNQRLEEMNKTAELGGGEKRIDQQHKKGKKTARERIALFLDEGSFVEIDKFAVSPMTASDEGKQYGDGVVTGYGAIDGRTVFVFSHDFTVLGGSLGVMFGQKVAKVMDLALKAGVPIVGLNDSGGARIQEGVQSLAAYSQIFFRNTISSGVIPQISLILGPCAGGAVYSPAMTDFVIMSEKSSYMFITGPDVVKAALGQDVTFEELGGADPSSAESGVVHFVARSEEDCFTVARRLLSFLPANSSEFPPRLEPSDDPDREDLLLDSVVPNDSNKPYEMKQVISTILDENDFLEVHSRWAPNIIVGFGRLDGQSVGIVANQPSFLAGALDINSSQKASRFVRTCDAFNIPIVTLVDVPGYMPGTEQEHGGIIRHGSKLLFAYCEATVPKLTVITRKAYGGAYCAMGSKYSRADLNFAWPSAEIAVMGPEGATNIIYRKEIEESNDPSIKERLVNEYKYKFANPFIAAETGIVDSVIRPSHTRKELIKALHALENKNEQRPAKKHGNIQL